ncbi:MAG: endolytic transglycosylase MltG [Candidatus Yanofskybacteria bacterium]|nr:endolytic transglycosylase MltG [Candidatus Yanofskybacteria bacterium]
MPAVLLSVFFVMVGLVFLPLDRSEVETQELVIEQGFGSAKVARLLAEQGLVRSRYLFIGYTLLVGKEKEFKAGRYLISSAMSIPAIVEIFSEGKAEPEGIMVTIPEGLNSGEIVAVLGKNFKGLKISDFQKKDGYLFPDTYWFNGDENGGEIIKKMTGNFNSKTKELVSMISVSKFREAIVIASFLEKEVKTDEDMRLVAGIIYKRLELGMPLQIDATVAYGACLPKWLSQKACDVSQVNLVENIKIDSQYNTYTRKELLLGPISNPGLKAINAALNPVTSDYLYYLSAREGGQTIFSATV